MLYKHLFLPFTCCFVVVRFDAFNLFLGQTWRPVQVRHRLLPNDLDLLGPVVEQWRTDSCQIRTAVVSVVQDSRSFDFILLVNYSNCLFFLFAFYPKLFVPVLPQTQFPACERPVLLLDCWSEVTQLLGLLFSSEPVRFMHHGLLWPLIEHQLNVVIKLVSLFFVLLKALQILLLHLQFLRFWIKFTCHDVPVSLILRKQSLVAIFHLGCHSVEYFFVSLFVVCFLCLGSVPHFYLARPDLWLNASSFAKWIHDWPPTNWLSVRNLTSRVILQSTELGLSPSSLLHFNFLNNLVLMSLLQVLNSP